MDSDEESRLQESITEVTIDEVWEEIGEFGPSQRKIIILLHLCSLYSALAIFSVSFTGTEPSWSCYSYNIADNHTAGTGESGNVTERAFVDPTLRCHLYDRGECSPEYSKEFTSIVTEVCQQLTVAAAEGSDMAEIWYALF